MRPLHKTYPKAQKLKKTPKFSFTLIWTLEKTKTKFGSLYPVLNKVSVIPTKTKKIIIQLHVRLILMHSGPT